MEEVKQRLVLAADTCVKAYDKWSADQKSISGRESLQEAIHELRKVASRLEIELAISERDQMTQKPIAIPPHRASRGKGNGDQSMDDNVGNSAFDEDDMPQQKPAMRRRLGGSGPRRPGGGSGNGGQE